MKVVLKLEVSSARQQCFDKIDDIVNVYYDKLDHTTEI